MTAPAVAMDPRLAARRVAVLRAQGRRRLHILAALAATALAATGAWWLSHTPLVDLDRVTITGVETARSAEVLGVSQLTTGLPMLYLEIDEAEAAVTALAWVKSARVRRDWPATVRIHVVPRVPVAVVPADGGRQALIDSNGYAVGWTLPPGAGAAATGLPHVSVPFEGRLGTIHAAADAALAVVAAMPADLRRWVSTVTTDESGTGVGLALRGGAAVALGDPVLLDDKMSAVRAVLAGVELDCVTEIDVTMPDLSTVARHPSCRS